MKTFGRILAYSVIVTSVISMLISVAGVIGVWSTFTPLVSSLTQIANVAETGLKTADEALTKIDSLVTALQQSMVEVQQTAEQLRTQVQTPGALVELLLSQLSDDVRPKVEAALVSLQRVRDAAVSVNETVQAVNKLPFLRLMGLDDSVQQLADSMNEAVQAVDDLQNRASQLKTGVTNAVIDPISQQAAMVEERLTDAQAELKTTQARVQLALQAVTALKSRIRTIVALVFVVITFQLLWGLLAQAAAIYVAWMYLKFGHLKIHQLVQAPAEAPAA